MKNAPNCPISAATDTASVAGEFFSFCILAASLAEGEQLFNDIKPTCCYLEGWHMADHTVDTAFEQALRMYVHKFRPDCPVDFP